MRKISALIVATAVVASLAACSSPATTAAGCTTGPVSGNASSLITVTGAIAGEPAVDFPTPLYTKGLEKTTLIKGDGQVLQDGDIANAVVHIYDGKTGAEANKGFTLPRVGDEDNPFAELAECSTVGSRIAGTIDNDGATFVVVMDLTARYLGKANGVEQIPQAGIPSVVLTPEGRPGVTIPNEAPPTELTISVLKQGDGETVKDGDSVLLNNTGIDWTTKEVFSSTWEDGTASLVTASSLNATTGAGLIEGLKTALVGQKVGSQVVVVVPPDLGFGDAAANAGVSADSTLVYVFDVLGIQK